MLQSIRDRTHGWIAGIIISLVILSFALWGIHSYIEGAGRTDVVAKVNGTEITKRQLAAAFEPLRNQVQSSQASILPEKVEAGLKQRALDALINVQVLKQAAIADHFKVSDFQIEMYLEHMQEFQVNGQFSLDRFKQLLASNGLSAGDFLQLIRTTLLVDQPKAGIVLSSFVLPAEVTDTVALINQERDVSYLLLNRDDFLKNDIQINDADVAAYYAAHQDEFKTPETVTIAYLILSPQDLAASIHPTPEELTTYYNDNLNSYTSPAQWKLQTILVPVAEQTTEAEIKAAQQKIMAIQQKLTTGTDFGTLAQQNPAGDKSADWATLNHVPADLQKTVATMTKKDQVSDVIKVAKGLMLVKVVDYKPGDAQPFEQVKTKVQDSLIKQKSQEKFADMKEKLANLTYEHPDSLDPAAKALGLTVNVSRAFTRDKGADEISSNQKIRDVAFSQDVLTSQNNSDVIQATPDAVVVLRDKSHEAASVQPLDAVKADVVAKLRAVAAEQKAADVAAQIKQKLTDGEPIDQVAADNHVTWTKPGFIGRYATTVDSAILYTAFKLPRPQSGHPLYATVKVPTGYAVVAANGVRDGVIDPKNQQQYDIFADQIQNTQGLLEYKLYEESLKQKATVKYSADFSQG